MNTKELHLIALMEECAELTKVCSKVMRFGINDAKRKGEPTNADRFIEEAGDVAAHIAMCIEELGLSEDRIYRRAEFKAEKFKRRHCL